MPWVRIDDQFTIHRKVAGLTDAAFRLHVSAIAWCARNLTDGFVPEGDLDDVCARVRTPSRFAAECVAREIWHESTAACPSEYCVAPVAERGWVIHDYLAYQFSKDQVIHNRETNKERQKRHRDSRNGVNNSVTNAVSNSTPSLPDPKNGSVGSGTERGLSTATRKPDFSHNNPNPNGTATRQPPPVADAIAAALNPDGRTGRHARQENPR